MTTARVDRKIAIGTSVVLALALSACGGGGGVNSTPVPVPPTANLPSSFSVLQHPKLALHLATVVLRHRKHFLPSPE
jgi:hypothetical protein